MGRMPRVMYLWPGLPQLWLRGAWSALTLATGFAALLNLALISSLVWVELLGPWQLRFVWAAVAIVWLAALAHATWLARPSVIAGGAISAEVLFRQALSEYLQGSWFEAERVLTRLVHLHPRDVEGQLLLATLLRRTRRFAAALDQLDRLERLMAAESWAMEIAGERRQIAAAQAATAAEPDAESNDAESNEVVSIPMHGSQAA